MIIKGSIERIIYKNDDNGFAVFLFDTEDDDIICTGNILSPSVGIPLELEGDIIVHSKYGEQFSFTSYKVLDDMSAAGVYNYLKSGNLPYIGEEVAKDIVDKFGEDTMDMLENNPEKLLTIKGIGPKKLHKIKEALEIGKLARKSIVDLAELGIFGQDAYNIYNIYQDNAKSMIMDDPYRLIKDVRGFGFFKADRIARTVGIGELDIRRVQAAIMYVIYDSRLEGNIFLYESEIKTRLKRLLKKDAPDFDVALQELIIKGDVVRKPSTGEPMIYPTVLNAIENSAASKTVQLIKRPKPFRAGVKEILENLFAGKNISYDETQKKAIEMALLNNIAIITGGPGTGKTTIVRAILEGLRELKLSFVLAAPTGRAAKRLEESSGVDAATLHRLLSLRPSDDDDNFIMDVEDIDADVVIVDEMSMVDINLYQKLLESMGEDTSLIMVGDADQLPSVGPGNVLKDLLRVEEMPKVKLETIHRTVDTSEIAVVAKTIKEGGEPKFNEKDSDVFFLDEYNHEAFLNELVELVDTRLPNHYGFDKFNDIQILSPTRKGEIGVNNLNVVLQEKLNPEKKMILKHSDRMFKLGDKVMQITNNYDREIKYKTIERGTTKGVFNGDIGIVTDVDIENSQLTVLFSDDYYAVYDDDDLRELELAYAITVHKSQGSEFPCIIFIAWARNIFLNNRNLLYTGITRAKELLISMGSRDVFRTMIKNTEVQKRNTTLKEKIDEVIRFEEGLLDM